MIQLSTVKKGDHLFENYSGEEIEVVAREDARRVKDREDEAWEFMADLVLEEGVEYPDSVKEPIHYLQTVGQEHYGPKLNRQRIYYRP